MEMLINTGIRNMSRHYIQSAITMFKAFPFSNTPFGTEENTLLIDINGKLILQILFRVTD